MDEGDMRKRIEEAQAALERRTIQVCDRFKWRGESIMVSEILVNGDDEVWIRSIGSENGECWNSLDVFREETGERDEEFRQLLG